MSDPRASGIVVANPPWVEEFVDWESRLPAPEDRMRLVIALARENVARRTGGPFGAAVFEVESGAIVSVGVNSVVRLGNSALHAEVIALMAAQRRLGSFTLGAPGLPRHEIVSSCEPCAMCLGATLWAGVSRVVWSATREDARLLEFDEGPVFPQSYAYLRERGLQFEGGVLRAEGRAVLQLYRDRGGIIYNG